MAFRSILIADDMLESSQGAFDEAVALAKLTQAKLTIVTVIPLVSPGFGMPVPVGDSFVTLIDSAKKRLEALKERLRTEGVREVDATLLEGDPVDRVVELAKELQPDLIVVGSRGLSSTGRFLLGSVSDGIVHHVRCSVLIVKGLTPLPSK